MRTLHVDSGREMRGGQWQALRLVERLPAEGVAATLLCRKGSPLYRRAAEAGIDVRPLSLWRLAKLARGAALVHAHDARSHTLAALAAPGRPLVVARRVAFPIRASWKYRRAARYIAVSGFVRQVMEQGGVAAERVSVVYDGVPLLPAARGGERVIAPELADPMKGADVVREAAALAGVEVHFSSNLEADLDGAGLFVYVTRSEGLGSAVLLAMSAGVPVIASKVGGIVEMIEDGVNGLLIGNTAECAAEAMRRVLADAAWARAMGERGRRTVEEKFSVDRMVRGTIDVYRKVLAC
jgi:glycosyltransferase involved in cell wall biosynthesis